MNSDLSGPASQLVELIRSSDVLGPMVQDSPDILAVFIQATEVAVKMSSDRPRLIAAVTRAADASDRVVEAISERNVVELADRILTAGREIGKLGEALNEFRAIAVAPPIAANSAAN